MASSGPSPGERPKPIILPAFERNFSSAVKFAIDLKPRCETKNGWVDIHPGLVSAIQAYALKSIEIAPSPDLIDLSLSFLDEKKHRWVILYPPCFNHCYLRFAITKELCHILTDDLMVYGENPSDQIAQAINVNEFCKNLDIEVLLGKTTWDSETFCFFMALEILFPHGRTPELLNYYNRGYSPFDIATLIKMPEALISFFFKSRYFIYRERLIASNFKPFSGEKTT